MPGRGQLVRLAATSVRVSLLTTDVDTGKGVTAPRSSVRIPEQGHVTSPFRTMRLAAHAIARKYGEVRHFMRDGLAQVVFKVAGENLGVEAIPASIACATAKLPGRRPTQVELHRQYREVVP